MKAVYKDIVFEQADVSIVSRARKRRDITYFQGCMLKMSYSQKQVEDVKIFINIEKAVRLFWSGDFLEPFM